LGTVLLILTYLAFILALEFSQNDIPGAQHYTALGVRAGWLAVAQVPLLILLIGKNNLIGFITGTSYERLNVLHRWIARGLLLLATIHFGAQSYGWARYGLMQLEWSTDTCPPTGIAAYAILLWLNLSTLAPFRSLSYEFFLIQHIITFFGFIIATFYHLPSTAYYSRVYMYIPVALYLVDRIVRTLLLVYHNTKPGKATLECLEDATKIRLHNKHLKKWKPGAHVLLSIPRFGIFQSHPVTIASIASSADNELVFIMKTKNGFTKRLWEGASRAATITIDGKREQNAAYREKHTVLVDGPYGGSNPDFAAFDTLVLIAGSTGVTFTLAQLLDIAQRASKSHRLPVRRVEFIWIVKKRTWTSWVAEELHGAFKQLQDAGIEVTINIFVTCDDIFTDSSTTKEKECGCECDKSLGPCCCANLSDEDDDDDESAQNVTINGEPKKKDKQDLQIESVNISSSTSSSSHSESADRKRKKLPKSGLSSYATFHSGRPNLYSTLFALTERAKGEMGVGVCGPMGLSASVRTTVARMSDDRAIHKGSGAQGICLHVESVWY
jgi:ferric-chelate reductase